MLRKLTKAQVAALVRKAAGKPVKVLLCGHKLYPNGHFGTFETTLVWHEGEGQPVVEGRTLIASGGREVPETFDSLIANWAYYNACWETGYYPAYYIRTK